MAARNPRPGKGFYTDVSYTGGAARGGGGIAPGTPPPSIAPQPTPIRNVDTTPAPRPAPSTDISVPGRGGTDAAAPPRTGPDGADLPPGQRNAGNTDSALGGTSTAAPGAPAPSLTTRARNFAGGAAGSVGLGVGLTGLTMALQAGRDIALGGIAAEAAGESLRQILEFLGEPVNLAIVAGVVAFVVIRR
jgi:hypothetical protein